MKRVILLGATGSIGTSACDVVRTHPADFRLVAVAAHSSRAKAEALGREFGARVYVGEDAALRAVAENDADLALVAVVGLAGLEPALAAFAKGMDVALATKEVLVMAGALVRARAKACGARIIPVDSEHSAIFQCLPLADQQRVTKGEVPEAVDHLTLTASGGPFLDAPADLASVTPGQALNHPCWKMGPKVTVDSATMMNKGFEILEARWLFGLDVAHVGVVVHPESVVHSLVTFADGATLAQLSPPDMRVPIQYALSWPVRLPARRTPLDLAACARLTFRAPDPARFPCLGLVKEACTRGGAAAAVLAAADETAVDRFLAGELRYTDIPRLLEGTLSRAPVESPATPEDVFEAVRLGHAYAAEF